MTLPGPATDRAGTTHRPRAVARWRETAEGMRGRLAVEWADPESRVDLVLAACALLLGLFSVVTLLAVGYLAHSKLPLFDAWGHWIRYLDSGMSWRFVFSQHNEHRIPVSRLLYFADEHWFNADANLLLSCSFMAQMGSALMLYRLGSSPPQLSPARRLYMCGVIVALVFSASQWINFTWTFQVCFIVVFFAAIAAFAALKNTVRATASEGRSVSLPWLAAAIFMGLVTTGSMANGLLVWPLLVTMAACLGLPRKIVGGLAVVGAVVIFAYLYEYQHREGIATSIVWKRTPEVVGFALAYLGSCLDEPVAAVTKTLGLDWEAYRVALCALAGLLGVLWFFDQAILTLRERSRQTPAGFAMLHVLAFLIASGALSAVGRVQFGMKDALTTRYATPSVLFWATLLALAFSVSTSERRFHARAESYRLRAAILLAAAFIGGLIQLPKVAYAVDAEPYLAEGEYALINNVFAPEGWQRFVGSGSAASMIPVVRYFREHRLASFSPEWTHWIGDLTLARFRMTSSDADCTGAWESVTRVGGSFSPAALAAGWGYDLRFKRAPERIVFADRTHRIAGFAAATRRRPDLLVAMHPEFSTDRVGWAGYLPAGLSSEVTAYVLLGDGRTICRVGGGHVPGTYLTTAAVHGGDLVAGVEGSAQGTWVRDVLPPGADAPPFATATWSSHALGSRSGTLRLSPVKAMGGVSIGLPLITGPGASGIRVSAIERGTGEVLAATNPPAGKSTWELWRLDLAPGFPATVFDYVIEQDANGAGDWVVVGLPRLIHP